MACYLGATVFSASCNTMADANEKNACATYAVTRPATRAHIVNAIRLTQADNGKTIETDRGTALIVSLTENPATGYTWAIESDDKKMIEILQSDYVPEPNLTPGSGGLRVFRLGVTQAGSTQLRLKRWHAWEGNESVVERFAVTILVRS